MQGRVNKTVRHRHLLLLFLGLRPHVPREADATVRLNLAEIGVRPWLRRWRLLLLELRWMLRLGLRLRLRCRWHALL